MSAGMLAKCVELVELFAHVSIVIMTENHQLKGKIKLKKQIVNVNKQHIAWKIIVFVGKQRDIVMGTAVVGIVGIMMITKLIIEIRATRCIYIF